MLSKYNSNYLQPFLSGLG